MLTLSLGLETALREACAALGGHPLEALLSDGRLMLKLDVVRDYVRRVEDHLRAKYPNYDDEEPGYDEADEDAYFDFLESWRNKLVYLVADVAGDDFLEG
jgi:hypothetical protein